MYILSLENVSVLGATIIATKETLLPAPLPFISVTSQSSLNM